MSKVLKLSRVPQLKKGSSGATLSLMRNISNEEIVRKSTSTNFFKLIDQYKWLNDHKSLDFIPEVSNPIRNVHSFSYDIKYYSNHLTLSEMTLGGEIEKASSAVISLLEMMEKYFYRYKIKKPTDKILEVYLLEKVLKKIKQCEGWNESYDQLFNEDYLFVNGVKYDNFKKVWKQINTRSVLNKLSKSQQCEIHGDLTAENVLVNSKNELILLDPNQENFYSSMCVDVSKLYQSFHSGYELIREIEDVQIDGSNVQYFIPESNLYNKMYTLLKSEVESKYDVIHNEILFHEAIHFARMLPYKIIEKKENFPIYYCKMIVLFNEVLNEI